MHWSYTFSQLPVDKPYYLVIDGYLVKERDGHQVTFDPAHADYPIHFDSMGDYLELGAYRINHEGDDPARPLEGTFPVTGTVRNGLGDDEYIAVDEQGRRYKVNGRGAYTLMPDSHSAGIVLSEVAYEDDSDMGYELRVQELDRVPEQLTFIRAKTMRWYGNTDAKIKIQELKSKGENRLEKK
ncbi:hypothetical protein AR543_16395 [Paenibacillus bovis]|uniref:Uncharacterized protein n=2 Tax=Paenibacillus bovis TaxID=1616788 RepID=A0A172ZJW5_9BACL|nr:hypothetical protein AR543_16395 [Paenibacillus bovis]